MTQIVRGGIKIETALQTPSLLRRAFPTPSGLTAALFDERVRPPGAPLRFVPAGWKSRYLTHGTIFSLQSGTGEV